MRKSKREEEIRSRQREYQRGNTKGLSIPSKKKTYKYNFSLFPDKVNRNVHGTLERSSHEARPQPEVKLSKENALRKIIEINREQITQNNYQAN